MSLFYVPCLLYCVYVISHVSVSVFFFKQNTAYEVRISDWSSDVCSSDLVALPDRLQVDVGAVDLRVALGGLAAFVTVARRSRRQGLRAGRLRPAVVDDP